MPEQDYDLPLYQSPEGEFFSLTPEQASKLPAYKPLGFTYRDAIAGGRQRIADEPSISKTAAQFLLGLEEGATVATPRAIGGGLEAASGLLPENYGGAALRKIGREAREGAGQIGKEYEDLSEGVGGGGAAKFARGLGSSVVPSASALLAAAPLGVLGAGAGATVTGSAVASGLQSLGGTFADAFEANKKRGMSDEEAYRKSYTPAILSGLVTGLVTKGFGGTGLEPILLGKAVPKGFAAAVREVAKDVGMEAVEEATDEAWQAVIRSTTFNPEATAEENLKGIIQAGIAGGLMAGVVRGAQSAPSAVNDLFAGKRPTAPTPPPLPVQPAPAAPVATATPAAITPAAALPAPAPVAPPIQPVAAQPIQQATPPTPTPRTATAPVPQPAPTAEPAKAVPPAAFPPIVPTRKDAQRVAADEPVSIKPTEPLPPNEMRMVSAGAKILAKQGFDPETAAEFAEHFVRSLRGEPASMEVFRADLVNNANQIGLVNPNTARTKNTSVEGLVGSGVPRERAEQVAKENALFNEARARQVTLSNREVLKRIPRVYPAKKAQAATPTAPAAEPPAPTTPKTRRVAITPEAQAAAPKRQQALPEAFTLPEPLEGQPYDTRLETRPEASMPALPAATLGIERGRVAPVDPDLAAAVEDIRGGYAERVARELADSESVNRVTPLTGQQRQFAEGLAKKYGGPAFPSVPAEKPYEQLSRFSNMLERAADRSKDPSELAAILAAASGAMDENRIAWAIIQNPHSSDSTYTEAKRNHAVLRMTSQENVDRTDSRRAELRAQRNIADYPELKQAAGNPFDTSASSKRLTELQSNKPRPIVKFFGASGGTPEQRAAHEAKIRKWNSDYRKAQKNHKELVEKSNEWIRSQKETPPTQPPYAPQEQAPVEVLRNPPPVTPAPVAEGKPREVSQTPLQKQWQELKATHPSGVLAVRLGDFYEFFFDDAKLAASVLKIALTKRGETPMAGVPYHAFARYSDQLRAAGNDVHIVDAVGNVKPGQPARREVVETLPSEAAREGAKETPEHDLTPKQFRQRVNSARAAESGVSLSEVDEFYPESATNDEYSKMLRSAMESGKTLRREVLDSLNDDFRNYALKFHPKSIPAGYLPPAVRKSNQQSEAEFVAARKRGKQAAQSTQQRDKSKPEQMTPEEADAYEKAYDKDKKAEAVKEYAFTKQDLQKVWDDLEKDPRSAVLHAKGSDRIWYAISPVGKRKQTFTATEHGAHRTGFYQRSASISKASPEALLQWLNERSKFYSERGSYDPFDYEEGHPAHVRIAMQDGKPVSAASVEAYKLEIPTGYIREGDLYVYRPEAKQSQASPDVGEQQVLDEISKLKSVTGPLSQSERIDLNELRLSAQNKKLSRLSQAYLENLEERAKETPEQLSLGSKAEEFNIGKGVPYLNRIWNVTKVKGDKVQIRDSSGNLEWVDKGRLRLAQELSRAAAKERKADVPEPAPSPNFSRGAGFYILANGKGTGEGPFDSQEEAQAFADSELGVPFTIEEFDPNVNSLGQTPTARPAPSLSKTQVEQAVRELFDGNTPPNFQVTHNYGKTYNGREVRGWYDPATGTIWLNAAYLRTPQEARAVFIEEAFHAIQNDKSVQTELGRLIASLTDEQMALVREAYGNISEQQLQMEAVADILEKQQLTQEQRGILARLWDAVIGAVERLYGRFTGKVFTERDAQDILAKALKAAAVGKRSLKGGGEVYAEGGLAAKAKAFFSRLFRTVEQSQQNKASGAQWKATIKNSKLGANLDEMALVGVNDLEDGKMYSRQEVLDYLQANQAEVKDVTLGGKASGYPLWLKEQEQVFFKNPDVQRSGFDLSEEFYDKLPIEYRKKYDAYAEPKTHFSTYQLPGAKEGSYREVLLTVPSRPVKGLSVRPYGDKGRWGVFNANGSLLEAYTDQANAESAMALRANTWRDGHSQYSSIANPIVRLRFNERTTQDGKRMLFLEEVQAPQKGQFEKMPPLFQKNWREIAFKWALRHAAENGFEVIGWTTGEQQAERYDLSKQVDSVGVIKRGNGTFYASVRKNGSIVAEHDYDSVSELSAAIGKELAEKASNQEVGKFNTYTGLDLKVGGEGLKKLYDVDFRNVVNKLPAVRSAGGKVGVAEISVGTGLPGVGVYADDPQPTSTIHSLPITPAISDSVMGGQAMFSAGSPQNQLDQKYFEAIQRGDMQEVQALVDEAARGAGYNVGPMFHGTDASFTEFKYGGGRLGQGFYFASNPSQAREYGGKVMRVFLREGNLLREGDISEGGFPDPEEDGYAFRDAVENAGYTGIDGFEETVVYSPSQIKSADPITYDDSGNIIPLSQRFQQESPDIRYSLGERVQGLQAENLGTKYADAIRASESAGSRQDFLRGTDAEIEAGITRADVAAVVRQGVGHGAGRAGGVRGLHSGSESATGKAVPQVRVFISTDALDSTARKNAEILANRIFPAEPSTKAAALSDIHGGDFIQPAARSTPFFVTIFSAEGEKSPLARTQTLANGTPAIIFNTTNLGKFNLQDAATAAQFDGVLSEELIHVAAISVTSQKEAQDVWASLSDKEKKAAERSYNRRRNKDALSDYELGHEYLRMVIQERMFGKTTEQVELRITEPVKKFLRKLLNFIKEAFGKKPENDIARQLVSRIESALNGEMPKQSSIIPSGTSLATNISQSDATEVQGRAIEPSLIAAAGKAVADLGRQTVEGFEQAGRQLEGLAYESKQFRQARSELNRLVKDHDGLLQQRYPDRADLRTSILEGVSVENGQIVVSDALVTKLAQMGIQFRPELVRAMQAEIYFEQQARRLVDTQEKRDGLIELRDYYQRIKAPDEEIVKLSKMITAKQKVITSISPVTTQRGGNEQSVAERANEIKQAEASKVELQSKRDALNLEPVQEFFGKGIAELRDLSAKAKAAADLTRALMDSSTSISEVARLGEIYDQWAGFDATVKDALKQGTLTDEQRVSVLTSLQQAFSEFDEAKFRMDDLLNSEEQGLLKDIREAQAEIADARVNSGMADILVADALKAAKGEMGLTGTVGDAANIAELEKSTSMISTLAENLGKTLDQNRWLYDFLMAPGDMPAFGASVAASLNISEDALREVLRVVQKSPSLASAIVTIADHAASKLASSPPVQMESIANLATSGNPLGMEMAANLTSKIVRQANAQGTAAKAVQKAAAAKLAKSVLRLRTLQQGQSLFNQTVNAPAFQQLRSAVAAGASEAQKMVVLGPTGPVLRGFKSAAKEYQPELKINVESAPLELQKTRDKVWKYLQNAEQYVEDYEAAAAAHAANPANPSPSQLGFDVADYNGLKHAIKNQIWPMFLNMGDMDDAARAGQYLTPVALRKLMKAPAHLGQIFLQYEQLGKMVGGFAGNILRQQIAKYKRGYLDAKKVASQFQDLPKLQSAAMLSHNIKNEDTYRDIFNEMGHYGREYGSRLRVGFPLPRAQQTVTREDMEFFKRTLAFEERLRRDVTEIDPVTGVRYKRDGKEITRKGAYVGDKGMPRHLNRDATQFIAEVTDAYAATPKGFATGTDLSASSTDEVVKYWNQHLGTLKQHILDSLRTDRSFKQSAEMSAAEKKIAARWLAGNMDQVNSVQDLVDLIAAEIPATTGKNPADVAVQGLNNELLQYVTHAERIQKDRADDNAKTSGLSIALSSDNEFTKPAAYLELPSEYYDYGALTSIDRITAQSRANHSALVDFANSLRLAIKELESRTGRLQKATTDKEREAILGNYKGNPQEMEDVLELLKTSLKNFEDSYRAGGPDIVPTRLGQKLLKATVGSVLAKVEIALRNLSQGQIQVFSNMRAMNYMSASLAAWKALSNIPRGLINTSYLVARNIAGFTDRRLGRDPQFQRTLKGAVDIIADGIFKSAQLALFKPRIGAANVRASFERVQNLGFDTSNDWWDALMQAWIESGQFRNQLEEDKAVKSRASQAMHFADRIANTGLDTINAFVRGSVLEASDLNMNALSLGLVGNMEQRLQEVAMVFGKRLTDAGITEIDPANKDAVLRADEWLPSMNQQTAVNSLGEIRKFLESSASSEGFHLEKNLLQYYQDKLAGKPARIFNQRTYDAVQRSMIAENNAALPTNRASAGQASTLWKTLLTLQGYPADAFLKLLRISTGGSRERKKVLQAVSKISLALGIAALAIIAQGAGDAGSELWKRKMQGKRADRVTPLDADFWSDPVHMTRAMGRYIMLSSYYLGNIIEAAYGWTDNRTTLDPSQRVFAIATVSQLLRDMVSGAKILKKGGSVEEGFAPLRRSITRLTFGAPELEHFLGKERDNTEAARRGMTENAKALGIELPSPGFGGTVGLTNIKRKALSQAVSDMEVAKRKGDTEGYNRAKAAAQQQLVELEAYYLKQRLEAGDSPDVAAKTAKASVWGDYQENNPVTAALGGKRPSPEQYKQLVENSTGERGEVIRQGIKAWQDGAQALFGRPGNITKEDVAANRSGGTVREPSYGRVSLTGGVSGRMKSVGTVSPGRRRAKIRRVSLTGRRRKISPMRGRRKKIRRVRLTA